MAAKYKRAPGGKQSRNDKDRGRGVFRWHAKPGSKVFVDGVNFVVVVWLDENVADENPREDGADRQLQIGVVAERESFAWRTKICSGSGFRGDERCEHSPPRHSPPAQCKVLEIFLLAPHVEADSDDENEIEQQNRAIDRKPGVHADLR